MQTCLLPEDCGNTGKAPLPAPQAARPARPCSRPGLCPGRTLQMDMEPQGGCPGGRAPPEGFSCLVGRTVSHLHPHFNCSSTQVLGSHPRQGTWSWGALGSPERGAGTGGGCPGQPVPAGPPGAAWSMPPCSLSALWRRWWMRSCLWGAGGHGAGQGAVGPRLPARSLTPAQSAPALSRRPRPCHAGRPRPSPGR